MKSHCSPTSTSCATHSSGSSGPCGFSCADYRVFFGGRPRKQVLAQIHRGGKGCNHEILLAFSCKGRYFCPSCHQKRVLIFGEWITEEILYPLPRRQYVFTVPKMLRPHFRFDITPPYWILFTPKREFLSFGSEKQTTGVTH